MHDPTYIIKSLKALDGQFVTQLLVPAFTQALRNTNTIEVDGFYPVSTDGFKTVLDLPRYT